MVKDQSAGHLFNSDEDEMSPVFHNKCQPQGCASEKSTGKWASSSLDLDFLYKISTRWDIHNHREKHTVAGSELTQGHKGGNYKIKNKMNLHHDTFGLKIF